MPRGIPNKPKAASIPLIGDSAPDAADSAAELAALRAENAKLKAAAASAMGAPLIREAEKPKASGMVSVACKVPMGLQLQLQHQQAAPVPTGRGGGHDDFKMEMRWVFGGRKYFVFGPSMPVGHVDGYILPQALEGGYAITHDIPADFWEVWVEQNQLAEYVTNKMIFAMPRTDVLAMARDNKHLLSGLQPLSRDKDKDGRMVDKRLPKPVSSALGRIGYENNQDADASVD